jgi:hypothetical protein
MPNPPVPGALSLFGKSQLTAEKFRAFILARNPLARPYVAGLVNRYYEQELTWGLRADLLLCQCLHETGLMTSWWSQAPRRNLCGLGVTGEVRTTAPAAGEAGRWAAHPNGKWYKGLSFASYQQAACAHYGHMWAYVGAARPNPALDVRAAVCDPRFRLAREIAIARHYQIVTLNDLDGRWAVPGENYSNSIMNLFNTVSNSKYKLLVGDFETDDDEAY